MRTQCGLVVLLTFIGLAGCGGQGGPTENPGGNNPLPPAPLAIGPAALPAGKVGLVYGALISASGGAGPYTWTVTAGALPGGLQLISGTPGATLDGVPSGHGVFNFTLEVADGSVAPASASFQVLIQPAQALSITTSSLPQTQIGVPYHQAIVTAGGSGAGYSWSVFSGAPPAGLALVQGTPDAALQGTPSQTGSFNFTLEVTDSLGGIANRPLSLNVTFPPLLITTAILPGGLVGTPYSQAILATGGSGVGFSWSVIAGSAPPGLNLSSSTPSATLQGTPAQAGSYNFTVRVTDSVSNMATQAFSVVVLSPLSISTATLPNAIEGVLYTELVTAAGGTPPYTWTIIQNLPPPGLTLLQGTPAATITGVPTAAGNYGFTLEVRDATMAVDTVPLTITVDLPLFRFTTPAALPYAVHSYSYQQDLAITGGVQPLGNWQVTSGVLPPGMALNTSAPLSGLGVSRLAGTPSASGNFAFTVSVSDATTAVATRAFTLTVHANNGTLVVASKDLGPWSTAVNLSVSPVNESMGAFGGTGTGFVWSIAVGSVLPAGVTLNPVGSFEGTPAQAGLFTFTVRVQDSALNSATRAFTVGIDQSSTGYATFFGEPVLDKAVFVVSADGGMLGSAIAALRGQLAITISMLLATHEFDIVAYGSQFGPANNYHTKLWSALLPATAANKAAAIAWVNGPSMNPGGNNTSYTALNQACLTYPATLKSFFYVNKSLPAQGGTAANILSEMPAWWAAFNNCHFTAIGHQAIGATEVFMQQLAALLSGTYLAS